MRRAGPAVALAGVRLEEWISGAPHAASDHRLRQLARSICARISSAGAPRTASADDARRALSDRLEQELPPGQMRRVVLAAAPNAWAREMPMSRSI
jgi:hypothetical protein